jgi:hypothetical protein
VISRDSSFRSRLVRALVLSWTINLGWLLYRTRLLQRPLFRMPAADPDRATPVWDVSVYAVVATLDAATWTTIRPRLPKQPELARGIYEYVPGLVFMAGARKLAEVFDIPVPAWRLRMLIPRGEGAVRVGVSTLLYGAVDRAMRD